MKYKSIAIDGPSGAGKSTLARRLAAELGFRYVDTGAIYRTVGLGALESGVDPQDPAAVTALLPQLTVTMDYDENGLQRMALNGRDVTEAIRRHEVSAAASQVGTVPAVREFLLSSQRAAAQCHDVVMDGRDIGTVVLPHADVKLFLTATPEDRARRRYEELLERGQAAVYEQVLADVMERDRRDSQRAVAPLRQAEDALLVDTTGNSLEESAALLLKTVKEALSK